MPEPGYTNKEKQKAGPLCQGKKKQSLANKLIKTFGNPQTLM